MCNYGPRSPTRQLVRLHGEARIQLQHVVVTPIARAALISMTPILSAIPYTTFPDIALGPLQLRTFGISSALGMVLGSWLAARHGRRHGVSPDAMYSLAIRMVVAGVIGARVTFVLSHWSEISGPLDAIAIWRGGLQFSGGFVAAVAVGYPQMRRWERRTRWHALDGYALGLSAGLALGRVACLSVGEHFGRPTSFFLGVRYDGGSVREDTLGSAALQVGNVFHQTALYELLYLAVLFGVLLAVTRRSNAPGVAMALFCGVYGLARFGSDSLRVNDERLLGMTGAQYLCLALLAASAWIWQRGRPRAPVDTAPVVAV